MANIAKPETTYGDLLIKQVVAPMLGLKETDPFDIVSRNDDLAMIHYRPDADLDLFGNLRGVVVDLKKGNIVSYSYPNAPQVVASSLESIDGNINLGTFSLKESQVRIKIGFEGTLIHVFKHAGKVYRTTRKRLDPSKSRWGNSKTFGEIYWELSGPSDEVLFDPTKDYSPYTHSFILVHPDVLVASRDDVGAGYLVYLGPKKMYPTTAEQCPYPIDSVDCKLHVPETTSSNKIIEGNSKIYSPENLTIEEANKHLTFGFYEGFEGYEYLDYRLLPGEFIVIEDTVSNQMFRVESPAYVWRSQIRNNNPNLLHRFFELIDFSYLKKEDDQKYKEMFPILTMYDMESLKSSGPIIVWPQNTEMDYRILPVPMTKDTKMYNIWQAFLIAVPLNRQTEVLEFYEILTNRRNELIAWVSETSDKLSSINLEEYSKRAQDILVKTRSFAQNRFKKGDNIDPRTKEIKSVDALTKDNIRNFILKEQGNSLYRLIREMDRFKNPRVETVKE